MAEENDPGTAVLDPAPEPAPTPEPQGTMYDPNTHVLVPKEQLEPYDGRFGTVMRESHDYRQAEKQGVYDDGVSDFVQLARDNKMSARELYDYITPSEPPPAPAPPVQPGYTPPAPPAPPPDLNAQPLTVGKFNELRAQEKADEAVAETDRQLGEEFQDVAQTLRGFKFNVTDDGRPGDSIAEIAEGVYNKCLNRVMQTAIPDWLTGAERQKEINAISTTPSTPAQRQEAKSQFQVHWQELQGDVIERFAKEQESVPGGSLEGGAGGPSQPQQGQLTYEQEVDQLATAVKQRQQGLPR